MENHADQREPLKRLFADDPFARELGIELDELRPGYARASMRLSARHLNFNGFIHGGAIFTLLDQAFAAASNSHNESAVAISLSVQFVNAPEAQGVLVAEAREVEKSRKLGLYEMTVKDEQGRLVCRADGRVYRIGAPILPEQKT